MTSTFITLNPGTISTVSGYCYGEFPANSDELSGEIEVVTGSLVLSGAHALLPATSVEVKRSLLRTRLVSAVEAVEGTKTWTGKHILFEKSTEDGNRVFSYGTVANTRWHPVRSGQFFIATRLGQPLLEVFLSTDDIVEVDLLNFCLRPFEDVGAAATSLTEIQLRHDDITAAWSIIAPGSKRDTASVVAKFTKTITLNMPDESIALPWFDFTTSKMVWHQTERLLNHSFYIEGKRTAKKMPASLTELEATEAPTVPAGEPFPTPNGPKTKRLKTATPKSAPKTRIATMDFSEHGGLTNDDGSDDEGEDAALDAALADAAARVPTASPFLDAATPTGASRPLTGGPTNNDPIFDDPRRYNPTNRIEVSNCDGTNQRATFDKLAEVIRETHAAKDVNAAKMTAAQNNVFLTISNGMCISGTAFSSASVLFENLQTQLEELGICFYPALCKGLYWFAFGRGIDVSEFLFADWETLAERASDIDMTDFSHKAKKPTIPTLTCISDLLQCLDTILHLSTLLFKPALCQGVAKLRQFVQQQQPKLTQHCPGIMKGLLLWVNSRLFALRVALSHDGGTIHAVVQSFSCTASEYAGICNNLTTKTLTDLAAQVARLQAQKGSYGDGQKGHQHKDKENPRGKGKKKGKFVSTASSDAGPPWSTLVKGLPAQKGQRVCFHFLTEAGCPDEASCKTKKFCHYKPTKEELTPDVVAALEHHVGKLRKDLA